MLSAPRVLSIPKKLGSTVLSTDESDLIFSTMTAIRAIVKIHIYLSDFMNSIFFSNLNHIEEERQHVLIPAYFNFS